jgi:hypothetical protein
LPADDLAFFEAKVRPLLVEHCDACHSAGAKTLRGGLRLDYRGGWETGGDSGPAVVPGKPEESLLIEAVRYEDAALKMPPKGKLPQGAIDVLVEWVKRGAPDPRGVAPVGEAGGGEGKSKTRVIDLEEGKKHWAFQPLRWIEPPVVDEAAWMNNPVDRFVRERMGREGLTPAGDAERRVLARRLWFDVTGLPPTPEEVDAFVADSAPDAVDRLVDRLLDSPHFGERWARHWLDLARWAESHGFEHDYDRPTAYPYRDFVIEALNRDLPYDRFVKWQIAGDEYEPENPLALAATGFLAAGTHATQITASQVEKERYDELDDMLSTTTTAVLGLTVGCARCHDHKYDPIPQRDYYRLLATFTTTVRTEYELPELEESVQRERERWEAEKIAYEGALARFIETELPRRLDRWERERRTRGTQSTAWTVIEPSKLVSKGGATLARQEDQSIRVEGKNPDFDTYTFVGACDLATITGVKIEALADAGLAAGGPGRGPNGNFALTNLKATAGPRYGIGSTTELKLINPRATFEQAGLPVSAVLDGDVKSGWAVDPQFGRDHAAVFELEQDLRTDGGATLTFELDFQNNEQHGLGRFRISVTDAPRPVGLDDDGVPGSIAECLSVAPELRTADQTRRIREWYATIDSEYRSLKQALEDHQRREPGSGKRKAMISSEGLPAVRLHTQGGDFLEKTHHLKRGDPNQKQEEATQSFLQVLMPDEGGASRWQEAPPPGWRTSYRRRALAEWLMDTEAGAGSLAARVIVNRLWQHAFGRGIVSTPSDFGMQGEQPTHPELLEHLANELVRGGWRLKPILRLILTSQTYRLSSINEEGRASIDPENRWLWRQNRKRLEAEPLRDAVLAVAGRLDGRMHGPGTLDERSRRRSIYLTVKRSQLVPMLALFDGPDTLVPLPSRASTTVAPQALLLINSPWIRDASEAFAERVRPVPGAPWSDAIGRAYRLALGRMPTDRELREAEEFLRAQTEAHRGIGHLDAEGDALTDLCQVIFCMNEFIYVE